MTKVNYEEFLKHEEWSLDTAISLINGEQPIYPNNLEREYEADIWRLGSHKNMFGREIPITNLNNRSYSKSVVDIKEKKLEAYTRKFEVINNVKIFFESEQEMYFVKPKYFIKWCNEKQISVNPELNKFFNYDYWLIHRKYWNFHEAVMVILSKNTPPFPHEIENVFEKMMSILILQQHSNN